MPHGKRSVDAHHFAMVPRNDVPRSAFDMRHTHKTTFNADYLVPLYVEEVLPGDSMRVDMTAFARLAPALVPPMDNLIMESFFFYVPYRLVWDNWARFMGEKNSPTDTTVFLVPQVTPLDETYVTEGTLYDYMGLTVNNDAAASLSVSALPFRAYNMIWNEWFRDQDLQTLATVNSDDGPDGPDDYILQARGKRHDYFTSARPWPQKPLNAEDFSNTGFGGPLIAGGRMLFPQGGAPVTGLGVASAATATTGGITIKQPGGRAIQYDPTFRSGTTEFVMKTITAADYPDVRVLVNDMRTANMVQVLMERNARGGTRYAELVRSHFGVVSPDARLQRPEYLGGGRTFINFSAVAQTSASAEATAEFDVSDTKLGEQAGVGTLVAEGHRMSQSFTEHGVVMCLVNVRSDLTYQQGIARFWKRRTQFDFYWPALAHLGEQAVLQGEIYSVGGSADNTVFGYQERWAEYRNTVSRVSGFFRSNSSAPLDIWHFSQDFGSAPVLNSAFVTSATPVGRVLQNGSWAGMDFLCDSMFDVRMVRPLPMFSIPGMGPRL